MTIPRLLKAQIGRATPELREYVVALKAENLRLHKQVARLQVSALSKDHRIQALEKEIKRQSGAGTVKDLMAQVAKRGKPELKAR